MPTDVRITTRYSTSDFLSALMGVLHETGHALYEQGLPKEWSHWPLGQARGMAIHESQSLFVEKQIARSPEFWEWALPHVKTHLGDAALEGFSLDDVLAHVHLIKRGLIRVDADEATYPLHVILRFELEQKLVDGSLEVADIPEAWHAMMTEYLGLPTLDIPQDGPMQDVHWPGGAFGYFPSYTLGALIAAQQWAALEKTIPDAREQMRKGKFDGDQRLAPRQHLVAGLTLVDAGAAGTRDRRAAQPAALHGPPEAALPAARRQAARATAAISSAWSCQPEIDRQRALPHRRDPHLEAARALERIEEGVGLARRRKADARVVVVDRQIAHRVPAEIDLKGDRRIVAGVRQQLVGEAEADLEHAVGAAQQPSRPAHGRPAAPGSAARTGSAPRPPQAPRRAARKIAVVAGEPLGIVGDGGATRAGCPARSGKHQRKRGEEKQDNAGQKSSDAGNHCREPNIVTRQRNCNGTAACAQNKRPAHRGPFDTVVSWRSYSSR